MGFFDKHPVSTNRKTRFSWSRTSVNILRLDRNFFYENSVVFMPIRIPTDDSEAKATEAATHQHGVLSLGAVFKQFQDDGRKRLVIAGYADGDDSGNAARHFTLSGLRAESVLYLLNGKRTEWADICAVDHQVKDYQQYLKYFSKRTYGDDEPVSLGCDPGKVDNIWGPKTEAGLRHFLANYNKSFPADRTLHSLVSPEAAIVPISQIMRTVKADASHKCTDTRLWKAFFDLYNLELARALNKTRTQLDGHRDILKFADDRTMHVACGQSFPLKDLGDEKKSGYEPNPGGGVELLFFNKDELPGKKENGVMRIKCQNTTDSAHTAKLCPVFYKHHMQASYFDHRSLTLIAYHLKFVYHDRILGKLKPVPRGLTIQAYYKKKDGSEVPIESVSDYNDGVYTVRVADDPTRKNIFFRFSTVHPDDNTKIKWILTEDKNSTPKIVSEKKDKIEKLQFSRRIKYYDLPEEWFSDNYWTRYDNDMKKGAAYGKVMKDKSFKPYGGKTPVVSKPLIFCLDDLVLTNDTFAPVAPNKDVDRAALFDDKFAVIDPDTDKNLCYFTKGKFKETKVNAVKALRIPYVDKRIHGVLYNRKLYAVFEDRVSASPFAGHRAAVYKHKTKCILVPRFQQHHYRDYHNIGKFDAYLLRDQGVDNDKIVSYIFNYFQWKLQGGGHVTKKWIDATITNLANEWNNGNNPVSLLHEKGDDKYRIYIKYFIEQVENNEETTVTVHPAGTPGRSNMGRDSGEIRANQNQRQGGSFVAAHEFGHATSLDDDYLEQWSNCCYWRPGFPDFKPGAPFNLDDDSMMTSNKQVRSRHYWHFSVWMNKEFIKNQKPEFKVIKRNEPDFELAYNSSNSWNPRNFNPESKNYCNWPSKIKRNTKNTKTNKGKFHLYLYPLGKDDYSQGGLYAGKNFTALLVVVVNLRFEFWAGATYGDIYNKLSSIHTAINDKFRSDSADAIKICGDKPYKETFVQIQPRYLVNNYVPEYTQLNSALTTAALYTAEVNRILGRTEADPHYLVDVHNHPTAWDNTTAPPTLKLKYDEEDKIWEYFSEMLGMGRSKTLKKDRFDVAGVVPNGTVENV